MPGTAIFHLPVSLHPSFPPFLPPAGVSPFPPSHPNLFFPPSSLPSLFPSPPLPLTRDHARFRRAALCPSGARGKGGCHPSLRSGTGLDDGAAYKKTPATVNMAGVFLICYVSLCFFMTGHRGVGDQSSSRVKSSLKSSSSSTSSRSSESSAYFSSSFSVAVLSLGFIFVFLPPVM